MALNSANTINRMSMSLLFDRDRGRRRHHHEKDPAKFTRDINPVVGHF